MQKKVQESDAFRQAKRFLTSFKEPLNEVPKDIFVFNVDYEDEFGDPAQLPVRLVPTFWKLSESGDELELIRLVTSKPGLTQRGCVKNRHFMFGLVQACLLRERLGLDQVKWLRNTWIYLRRDDDVFTGDNASFKLDLFAKDGRNILTVCDEIGLPTYGEVIKGLAYNFYKGIDPQECSKSDCERCAQRHMCAYEPSPLALVKLPSEFNVKDACISDAQMQAIDHEDGCVVIDSCPGSGKTFVVALHFVTLLMKGIPAKDILAFTYTKAGAEEMAKRVVKYAEDFGIEVNPEELNICTMHSWGYEVLKLEEVYTMLGFTGEPKVINETERSKIIEKLINKAVAQPYFDAAGNQVRNPLESLNWRRFTDDDRYSKGALAACRTIFDVMKEHDLCAADIDEIRRHVYFDSRYTSGERFLDTRAILTEIALLYNEYCTVLRENNMVEFADMLKMIFDVKYKEPFFFEKFGYSHIIVDEFQDTNEEQINLINILKNTPTFRELMLVGDGNQSIFAFRGTSNKFIKDPDAYMDGPFERVYLYENYRSVPGVLDFANKIKAKNEMPGPDIVAVRPDNGKKVHVQGFLTKEEEEEFVVEQIKKHEGSGTQAIICRKKDECRRMAGRLHDAGIQAVMMVPELLVENSRVLASIAFCRAVRDGENSEESANIQEYTNARIGGGIMTMDEEDVRAAIEESITIINSVKTIGNPVDQKEKLMECLKALDFDEDEVYQGFLAYFEWKNIDSIFEFIEDFVLYGVKESIKRDHSYPGVAITTAHSSKGLEWDIVYNMISSYDRAGLKSGNGEDVQEERRLFFVSATRARDELYVTGQYVAFGKKGDYSYNRFLIEAYDATDQTFSVSNIETEREMRAELKKARKAEERNAKMAKKEAAVKE